MVPYTWVYPPLPTPVKSYNMESIENPSFHLSPEKNFIHLKSPMIFKFCMKCTINNMAATFVQISKYRTLLVPTTEYFGRSRSISWLPILMASPAHQQPWHWRYTINESLSSMRNDFSYLCCPGRRLNIKTVFPGKGNSMLMIRRSHL